MTDIYHWIGVGVVFTLAAIAVIAALFSLYLNLIHGRFGLIFFARRPRRLSIASWHHGRISRKDEASGNDDWPADDFPINERPFLLTYRVGKRSYFVMAGHLAPYRNRPIKGTHP